MSHKKQAAREFIRNTHVFAGVVSQAVVPELLSRAGAEDLTYEQLNVLKLIRTHGAHTLKMLAGFLAVTPPAASVMVDKLVNLGFVARTGNPEDRREILISITARGRRIVERFQELSEKRFSEFLSDLSDEEVTVFNRVVHRFTRTMLKSAGPQISLCLQCGAFESGGCLIPDIEGICHYLPAGKGNQK